MNLHVHTTFPSWVPSSPNPSYAPAFPSTVNQPMSNRHMESSFDSCLVPLKRAPVVRAYHSNVRNTRAFLEESALILIYRIAMSIQRLLHTIALQRLQCQYNDYYINHDNIWGKGCSLQRNLLVFILWSDDRVFVSWILFMKYVSGPPPTRSRNGVQQWSVYY